MKKSKQFDDILIYILIGSIIRIIWMLISDNSADGDAPSRLYAAIKWSAAPSAYPGSFWFPGHYYILGGIIHLFHEVVWIPRIVHLVFSIATIYPFYILVKEEFNDEVAYYSTIVFCFMFSHIILSSITITEPISLFFIICGMLAISRYCATGSVIWFALIIFNWWAAEFLRHDAWYPMVGILIWFYYKSRSAVKTTILMLLLFMVPALLLYLAKKDTGDPFYAISHHSVQIMPQFVTKGSKRLVLFGTAFFSSFTVYLLPFCFLKGKQKLWNTKATVWSMVFILPMLYVAWKMLFGVHNPKSRAIFFYAVLLIPVLTVKLLEVIENPDRRKIYLAICNGASLLILFIITISGLSIFTYDKGFKDEVDFAKTNLRQKRFILDNQAEMNLTRAFLSYSNAQEIEMTDTARSGAIFWDDKKYIKQDELTCVYLDSLIRKYKIEYLVLLKNGSIDQRQNTSMEFKECIKNKFGNTVFDENGYKIVAIGK